MSGGEILSDEKNGESSVVSRTATTFWIRSPTPPNSPESVARGEPAYSVGPPLLVNVKIDAPSVPDAAVTPHAMPSGDMDFDFKPIGTPKAPRAVVNPDA